MGRRSRMATRITHRRLIQALGLSAASLALPAAGKASARNKPLRKPNIVSIMAHDVMNRLTNLLEKYKTQGRSTPG